MKPEAQRIAVAKACGWKDVSFGVGRNSNLCLGDRPMTEKETILKNSYLIDQRVPDYLNDLNAMREVERTIPYVLQTDYLNTLADVLGVGDAATNWSEDEWGIFKMVSATASQRAEAFLRTLNLWQD